MCVDDHAKKYFIDSFPCFPDFGCKSGSAEKCAPVKVPNAGPFLGAAFFVARIVSTVRVFHEVLMPTGYSWIDMGPIPVELAYCPDAKSWRKLMKRLGSDEPYPSTNGRCTQFERGAEHIVVVTIDHKQAREHSAEALIGLLAHEALHVWHYTKRWMDEKEPGDEIEAYTLQHIVSGLVHAFHAAHGMPAFQSVSEQ